MLFRSVAYATSVVTVTATRNHVAATLSYAASPGSCQQPVARATLPPSGIPCTLEVGVNLITVTVTAEDDTTQDYVITITREAAALSSDAALSGLAITPGALHPSFVSSTLGYTETVAYATSVVTVTATRNHVAEIGRAHV